MERAFAVTEDRDINKVSEGYPETPTMTGSRKRGALLTYFLICSQVPPSVGLTPDHLEADGGGENKFEQLC